MVVALARVKSIDTLMLERTPGVEAGDGDGGLKGRRGSNVTPVEGRTSKLILARPSKGPCLPHSSVGFISSASPQIKKQSNISSQ